MNQTAPATKLRAQCLRLDKATTAETGNLAKNIRRVALEAARELYTPRGDARIVLTETFGEFVVEAEEKVEALRCEFQYDDANPFERLIIEQILTAWVQWYVAGLLLEVEQPGERTWRQNQYFVQRYQLAQSRLAKSIDQLAKMRQISKNRLVLETVAERDARIKKQARDEAKWKRRMAKAMNQN